MVLCWEREGGAGVESLFDSPGPKSKFCEIETGGTVVCPGEFRIIPDLFPATRYITP